MRLPSKTHNGSVQSHFGYCAGGVQYVFRLMRWHIFAKQITFWAAQKSRCRLRLRRLPLWCDYLNEIFVWVCVPRTFYNIYMRWNAGAALLLSWGSAMDFKNWRRFKMGNVIKYLALMCEQLFYAVLLMINENPWLAFTDSHKNHAIVRDGWRVGKQILSSQRKFYNDDLTHARRV